MTTVYPAAHSMDTEWFALDRDGFLAFFNSDETGAVPVCFQAIGSASFESFLEEVLPLNPRGEIEVAVDLEPLMKMLKGPERLVDDVIDLPPPGYTSGYECLFHLRNEDVLDSIKEKGVIIRFKDERVVAYVDKFSLYWVRQALERDEILGFYKPVDDLIPFLCKALGLFLYEEEWSAPALPYARLHCPEEPLHCSLMEEAGREKLAKVTFNDLSFAEREAIQPPEHMDSVLWRPYSWIGTDGRIHEGEDDGVGPKVVKRYKSQVL